VSIGWDREVGDGWTLVAVHIRIRRWTFQLTFDVANG